MIDVVFIDDDPDIAGVINAVGAADPDCNVEIFNNGTDALKRLNEKDSRTDVVVLDLRLPTLDGLTIAEEIRRNEEIHLIKGPVELLFLTGQPITDAVQRVGTRVNVRKIFHKPCDYPALLKEIKSWFQAGDEYVM